MVRQGGGGWKEFCVTFDAAAGSFGGGGPRGADIWLTNGDAEDDVFDSVELSAASASDMSFFGDCNSHSH